MNRDEGKIFSKRNLAKYWGSKHSRKPSL